MRWKSEIVLDAETYYDTEYSLSKMATSTYIRDPRFKVHGWSMKVDDGKIQWLSEDELLYIAKYIDWDKVGLIGHNLCLTPDHEVRTREGWKPIAEVTEADEVMQWDHHTAAMSFVHPQQIIAKPYDGPVYEWNTTYHKGVYTPEHRMYFRTPDVQDWRVETAAQVSGRSPNNVYVPSAGRYTCATSFPHPPAVLRLMEACRADAHVLKNSVRFNLVKERKIRRLIALAEEAGAPISVKRCRDRTRISLLASEARTWITDHLLAFGQKGYGPHTLDLCQQDREIIIDEIKYWDGWQADGAHQQTNVATSKEHEAQVLADLAVFTGFTARVSGPRENTYGGNNTGSLFYVSIRPRVDVNVIERAQKRHYTGPVHCLVVPSRAFLVRRNGAYWITGNCFDGAILNWKYGINPACWIDTLGMARAVLGNRSAKFGLDHVAQMLGLKGKVKGAALTNVKGVRDLTRQQWLTLGAYAKDDVKDTYYIRHALGAVFPKKEYWVMDWSIRMFTEPKLLLDYDMLSDMHEDEVARKKAMIDALPYSKTDLSSNQRFAEILRRDYGTEPPVKVSKTTHKETYAFSKNDLTFQALYEEAETSDPDLRDLLDARLAIKSTITETRSGRFRDLAKEGPWAVPLNYAGARQTKRFSGGQKQNPQNLSARGPGKKIRQAIHAPKGYKIFVIDSSNIELRTNATAAGQMDVIERLKNHEDEYSAFAGAIYHRKISKQHDPTERQVGKVGVLSLGYQSGAVTFRGMLKAQAGILMDIDECTDVVNKYRATYPHIKQLWRENDIRVKMLAKGVIPPNLPTNPPIEWFLREGENGFTGGVRSLYSGSVVEWNDLRWGMVKRGEEEKKALIYTKNGTGWTTIYGGKVTENISQFLAREVLNWQTKNIWEITGYRPQLQVHDEDVYVLPESEVEDFQKIAMACMTGRVPWWPGIWTNAESDIADCYGDAK